MENVLIDCNESAVFDNKVINEYIELLQKCIKDRFKNDFEFLCILQNIRMEFSSTASTTNLVNSYISYEEAGCHRFIKFYDFFEDYFHLSAKTIKNYLLIAYTFLVQESGPAGGKGLKFKYRYKFDFCKDLTISKMQELVSLSDEQIRKVFEKKLLTPRSTREQIRRYVKSLKGGENEENKVLEDREDEIIEEDIPMAYDPSMHYEDTYFMGLAKSQLVNNIITLQDYCEKLQAKIKELKKKTR